MNDISDNAIMAALGRHMTTAVARQAVAAGNLANLDTPGYRARELAFDDFLDGAVQRLDMTGSGGQLATEPAAPSTTEAEGLEARRDGNNVQLDRELLALTSASGQFSAAQTALAAKFRLVRYAINEGR